LSDGGPLRPPFTFSDGVYAFAAVKALDLLVGGLVALVIAVALALLGLGPAVERSTGVIRDPQRSVEIRYLLCPGQRIHFIRLLDYGRGYGSGWVGPVVWQLRSHAGSKLERLTVGHVPPGFEEDVRRLPLPGPSGRTVVTDPDGDDVMSFVFSELRRERIFRADYLYVTPSRFAASKNAYCAERTRALRYRLASYPFFAVAVLALGGALVQRIRSRRRKRRISRG
jgi:hypothetical protein